MKDLLNPLIGTKCYMQGRILTEEEKSILAQRDIVLMKTHCCIFAYVNHNSAIVFSDNMRRFYENKEYTIVDSTELTKVLDTIINAPLFKKFEPVIVRHPDIENNTWFVGSYQELNGNANMIIPNIVVAECYQVLGNEHLIDTKTSICYTSSPQPTVKKLPLLLLHPECRTRENAFNMAPTGYRCVTQEELKYILDNSEFDTENRECTISYNDNDKQLELVIPYRTDPNLKIYENCIWVDNISADVLYLYSMVYRLFNNGYEYMQVRPGVECKTLYVRKDCNVVRAIDKKQPSLVILLETENLRYAAYNSLYDDTTNDKFVTLEEAIEQMPDGYRLPLEKELEKLFKKQGTKALPKHGCLDENGIVQQAGQRGNYILNTYPHDEKIKEIPCFVVYESKGDECLYDGVFTAPGMKYCVVYVQDIV